MATIKATMVSTASLGRSVDKAVKLAAARHGLKPEKDTLVERWEIFGRRLRAGTDLNQAYDFANEVAGAVKLPGLRLEPVVSRIGRDILVGFIEKGRLPLVLR